MKKYDCDNCEHRKTRTVTKRGKCQYCVVDTKDLDGKPSQFKEKKETK